MNYGSRQKFYFVLATIVFLFHLCVAAVAKPSFLLTMYGDATPCALLILAILAVGENFRRRIGILPLFWKLFAGSLGGMLLSQIYWFYFDWRKLTGSPSPITGDTLFLLSNVFFLAALALRPHSAAAGRNLQIRFLDLILLSFWWLALYGYFSLPWQIGRQDFSHYNPSYYTLAFLQHLVIIIALAVLWVRTRLLGEHSISGSASSSALSQAVICYSAPRSIRPRIIQEVFGTLPFFWRSIFFFPSRLPVPR